MNGYIKLHRKLSSDRDEYLYRDQDNPTFWERIESIREFGTTYTGKSDPSRMLPDGGWLLLVGDQDDEERSTVETGDEIAALIVEAHDD